MHRGHYDRSRSDFFVALRKQPSRGYDPWRYAIAPAFTLIWSIAISSAAAQQAVSVIASPNPVVIDNNADCIFLLGHCAQITTHINGASVDFTNEAHFNAGLNGVFSVTSGANAPISIDNAGSILAAQHGVSARAEGSGSDLSLKNRAGITAGGDGIAALIFSFGAKGSMALENAGDIVAGDHGINAETASTGGDLSIVNRGRVAAGYMGIFAFTPRDQSRLTLKNTGDIMITGPADSAEGIFAETTGVAGDLKLENSGAITTRGDSAHGLFARTSNVDSFIALKNSGDILTAGPLAHGISAASFGGTSPVSIDNSGDISAAGHAYGITAESNNAASAITINNIGDILAGTVGVRATSSGEASPIILTNSGFIDPIVGLHLMTSGLNSPIAIDNAGTIEGTNLGIGAITFGEGSPISITNSGKVTSTGGDVPFVLTQNGQSSAAYAAIAAATNAAGGNITIQNFATLEGLGSNGIGLSTLATAAGSKTKILNTGGIHGSYGGIFADSAGGTEITNAGDIAADSGPAINVYRGSAEILNAGLILGYVMLDADDSFINQSGGTFAASKTSDFGPGADLFRNEEGATVQAAANPNVAETTRFINLERFDNQGSISTRDGGVGDVFRISNTPGGADLEFVGSGKSTLAVDVYLGGPGSLSDTLIVDGSVSSKTKIELNVVNSGPGVFNSAGIPVIYVNGPSINGDEFYVKHPIDTGFFDYDLFFTPTGSGVFDFKSFLGPSAFVLPQLVTATQDIWHTGSDMWFDRTADLRVLLNGGSAPTASVENAGYGAGRTYGGGLTPAVWARGAGSWLDRDRSESVTAYGSDYRYKLDRNLGTIDFQTGLDLGKRGLLSQNDILVFGVLGGFVHGDLDYDQIGRHFDFDGGQVGGYATYLRGGLFVDTLLNVHIMEIDTNGALGFPGSLNDTNIGLRTDTGYRFGSFHGGAFIEPLATLSINWAAIDSFSLGGNRVAFDDDPNVRGRLGLRVGTSVHAWSAATLEPFVIGSVWGNLADSSEATLISSGTTFHLEDNLDDVWGEVSAGVNLFNASASTSVFAKVDVTFGDNVDGVGGKAGMRVSW